MGKIQALRLHAKRRALERYNFDLNRNTRKEIIAGIQQNKYKFLERTSNRTTVWLVHGMRVVYDKSRKELITFLPPETEKE